MLRVRLPILLCLIAWSGASTVEAQHHHGAHHNGYTNSWNSGSRLGSWSTTYVSPVGGTGSYLLVAVSGLGGRHHHHYQTQVPVFVSSGPEWFPVFTPLVPQANTGPVVSVFPIVHKQQFDPAADPAKQPVKPSSPAARLKSLEHQSRGDEKLRKHLWAQAYMHYRSAIDVAGDRGEGRFRQGFTYTAMQHYTSAVREFKRGLFLDPQLPVTGIKSDVLFGPGSAIVRTSILHKVADWVREDPRDPDRLFLLGLMLHYEDDPRCCDVLKAAQRMAGGKDDHIAALLAVWKSSPPVPAGVEAKPPLLPELPPLPDGGSLPAVPIAAIPILGEPIPGAPIPDPPVLKTEPQPVMPPTLLPTLPLDLPPLSDRPTPPTITPVHGPKNP